MKYLLVVAALATSCGAPNPERCVLDGEQCRPENADTVTDEGPTVVQVPVTGARGPRGPAGAPGSSCAVRADGLVSCGDGSSYQIPAPKVGPAGADGADGQSCSIADVDNGAIITCGEEHVVIVDGADGADAPPTAYSVTELIDPCGDSPGKYDEVLLRLANGTLLAHYADGAKQFLAVIGPGTYVTTDYQSCVFTVSPANSVSW